MPAAAQMRPQPGMAGAGPQGPRPGYKYTTAVRNPGAPGAVPQGAQMQQVRYDLLFKFWFLVFMLLLQLHITNKLLMARQTRQLNDWGWGGGSSKDFGKMPWHL